MKSYWKIVYRPKDESIPTFTSELFMCRSSFPDDKFVKKFSKKNEIVYMRKMKCNDGVPVNIPPMWR